MISLFRTNTPPQEVDTPQSTAEEAGHAFAGSMGVKTSDISNKLSQCWPENRGYCLRSFQERTVSLYYGDHVNQMMKQAPGCLSLSLDEVLQVANDLLTHPLNNNWSKGDKVTIQAVTYCTLAHLPGYKEKFPSEREAIEQKISELRQYLDTLDRYDTGWELEDE